MRKGLSLACQLALRWLLDTRHGEGSPCALQSSVMEGAGRKLRGYDSIRLRNTIMQQTGFLETPTKERALTSSQCTEQHMPAYH